MAENRRDKQLFWIDPEVRGILPLDNFHIPRSLKKKIRNNPFEVRIDHDFAAVIRACAQQKPKRRET
ncbi:MAG: leucyl/phenylalanyl-tRNA--protein transferase, partial [Rhodospirillales bacterium]